MPFKSLGHVQLSDCGDLIPTCPPLIVINMYRPHYAVIELFSEELIGCYHSKKEAMQAIEEAGSLEDYQLFELVK